MMPWLRPLQLQTQLRYGRLGQVKNSRRYARALELLLRSLKTVQIVFVCYVISRIRTLQNWIQKLFSFNWTSLLFNSSYYEVVMNCIDCTHDIRDSLEVDELDGSFPQSLFETVLDLDTIFHWSTWTRDRFDTEWSCSPVLVEVSGMLLPAASSETERKWIAEITCLFECIRR